MRCFPLNFPYLRAFHPIFFLQFCNTFFQPQVELDEGVLRKLARTAAASLNPMAAMFGGVVGQEVRRQPCFPL